MKLLSNRITDDKLGFGFLKRSSWPSPNNNEASPIDRKGRHETGLAGSSKKGRRRSSLVIEDLFVSRKNQQNLSNSQRRTMNNSGQTSWCNESYDSILAGLPPAPFHSSATELSLQRVQEGPYSDSEESKYHATPSSERSTTRYEASHSQCSVFCHRCSCD